ncbi:hypothetical protein F5148DRAFT_1153262 [Russula earlei]|uniref:Uncharacterized protein n=1 Tax=Russula earlei TaxID=71964 RepID=A0ACC0TV41_9AGAM|nr:hypothetical protein F5148DRAFT_1153262 [Russula earlei]
MCWQDDGGWEGVALVGPFGLHVVSSEGIVPSSMEGEGVDIMGKASRMKGNTYMSHMAESRVGEEGAESLPRPGHAMSLCICHHALHAPFFSNPACFAMPEPLSASMMVSMRVLYVTMLQMALVIDATMEEMAAFALNLHSEMEMKKMIDMEAVNDWHDRHIPYTPVLHTGTQCLRELVGALRGLYCGASPGVYIPGVIAFWGKREGNKMK